MNLKEQIRSGAAFHIGLASPAVTVDELAAGVDGQNWDILLVDIQHNPYTEPQLVALCKSARALDLPVMFRIPHPDATWQIGRFLDFGAAGILVPMIEDPMQVSDAIRNFYYPPIGGRSCGLSNAYGWAGIGGNDPCAYIDWWNKNGILALQLETVQAIQKIRKLVQPEVDLLLFGRRDMSFSIEAYSDCPFTSLADCQRYVLEQTQGMDVRVGVSNAPYGRFESL
jgi:2-keto-3-deoxy-L-rhamnonate aldolase RhmA